jgi:alpha-tubulin suppressor-like RCC1 family protein
VTITAGESQVCVFTQHGDAECWGSGLTAAKVTTFTSNVAAISSGGGDGEFDENPAAAACAITTGGAVWCWGDNAGDELGNGGTTASSVPTPVSGLTSGVTSLSVGVNYAVCAIQSGNVWCWGSAGAGALGNGSASSTPVPVELAGFTGSAISVAVGSQSACAIIADGGVECWGSNGDGELGNGTKTSSLAPVPVTGITSGATAVAVGTNYACAIVSGAVQCWGNNGFGATTTPSAVSGLGSGATSISIGDQDMACAVVNGGIQCWGSNQYGFFGNNSTTNSAVPVPVTTLTTGVKAVAVGPSYGFPCAITNSGAVWCWATKATASVPVRVAGFPQ